MNLLQKLTKNFSFRQGQEEEPFSPDQHRYANVLARMRNENRSVETLHTRIQTYYDAVETISRRS